MGASPPCGAWVSQPMTIESIRAYHSARPYRPFTLVLADGTRVPVPHPELLAHPGSGRTVIVFEGPDVHRVIDRLLVTALAVGVNGSGRRAGKRRRRSW